MKAMSDPGARFFAEATAVGITVSSVLDWLPKIAVALAIVWYVIQIRESETWRRLFRRAKLEEDFDERHPHQPTGSSSDERNHV